MATPSPSRVATVGAVVGNVAAAATRPMRLMPVTTLNTAESSGKTAATIDPNMINSSTRASTSPMTSDLRSCGSCAI